MAIHAFVIRVGSIVIAAVSAFAIPALAVVSVSVSGNVATAQVQLPNAAVPTSPYTATVTITFDSAFNLTPQNLNVTAEIIDPATFSGLPQVSIDPNFPVLISVEPPPALFVNGFEAGQVGNGSLYFFNTYEFDIDTPNLACSGSTSTYRLYKAPHGSNSFNDVTEGLYHGSVRARGRGGAFSQFVVANDQQSASVLAQQKFANLNQRVAQATLSNALRSTLDADLANVNSALSASNYATASSDLGTFTSDVQTNVGTNIANEWMAGGALSNDAGEMLSLAQTLSFTLQVLQGTPVCLAPPP